MKTIYTHACAIALGIVSLFGWQAMHENVLLVEKVQKLETDVRTYSGKYLDLQEAVDEEKEALTMAVSVQEWRAIQAETTLKACQNKSTPKKGT